MTLKGHILFHNQKLSQMSVLNLLCNDNYSLNLLGGLGFEPFFVEIG